MTIAQIAVAARDAFPGPDSITMLAIAGAESAYKPMARGDNLSDFPPELRLKYTPFACADFLSFGAWQIFLGVHSDLVSNLSNLSGACPLANWLMDPANNARAASRILASEGFGAWSTYGDGRYTAFIEQATQAINALPPGPGPQPAVAIVAVSLNGTTVHLDRIDGTFDERTIATATAIGEWLRFDLDRAVMP